MCPLTANSGRGAGRYILATPIGRVKEIKDEVLGRPGRYAEIAPNLRAKEVIVGAGERRRRYILCLNVEEAEREKRHREEILDPRSPAARARVPRRRSPQGRVPPGRLQALRPLPPVGDQRHHAGHQPLGLKQLPGGSPA
jgi:hypothetical protein